MPKKFSFRLEPILNLRSHRVRQEKEALLQIQGMRIAKENEIQDNIDNLNSLYRNKIGKISVEQMQIDFHRQNYIKELIKKLEADKLRLLEIEEQRRIILNEALKEEKVLEKLKEKKHTAYKEELNLEDMKMMDEIANNKVARTDYYDIEG